SGKNIPLAKTGFSLDSRADFRESRNCSGHEFLGGNPPVLAPPLAGFCISRVALLLAGYQSAHESVRRLMSTTQKILQSRAGEKRGYSSNGSEASRLPHR